jgi:hypothetical protein
MFGQNTFCFSGVIAAVTLSVTLSIPQELLLL